MTSRPNTDPRPRTKTAPDGPDTTEDMWAEARKAAKERAEEKRRAAVKPSEEDEEDRMTAQLVDWWGVSWAFNDSTMLDTVKANVLERYGTAPGDQESLFKKWIIELILYHYYQDDKSLRIFDPSFREVLDAQFGQLTVLNDNVDERNQAGRIKCIERGAGITKEGDASPARLQVGGGRADRGRAIATSSRGRKARRQGGGPAEMNTTESEAGAVTDSNDKCSYVDILRIYDALLSAKIDEKLRILALGSSSSSFHKAIEESVERATVRVDAHLLNARDEVKTQVRGGGLLGASSRVLQKTAVGLARVSGMVLRGAKFVPGMEHAINWTANGLAQALIVGFVEYDGIPIVVRPDIVKPETFNTFVDSFNETIRVYAEKAEEMEALVPPSTGDSSGGGITSGAVRRRR